MECYENTSPNSSQFPLNPPSLPALNNIGCYWIIFPKWWEGRKQVSLSGLSFRLSVCQKEVNKTSCTNYSNENSKMIPISSSTSPVGETWRTFPRSQFICSPLLNGPRLFKRQRSTDTDTSIISSPFWKVQWWLRVGVRIWGRGR